MTNLNLIKLIIGMQLELRTIVQKAGDMEATLVEIMAGVEQGDAPSPTFSPEEKEEKRPFRRYAWRSSPEWRAKASMEMQKFWASPEGQRRKAEVRKRRDARKAERAKQKEEEKKRIAFSLPE